MNICLVSHSGGLGGAELAILETAGGLKAEGHSVYIVCPNNGTFVPKAREVSEDVAIIPFDHWTSLGSWRAITKLKMARGYWLAARNLSAYFLKIHADVIVTNTSTFPSAAIAAKSSGIPHIWYLHEFVEEDHGLTWEFGQEKSYKLIDKLSAAVVVNSIAVRIKVERYIKPKKLHLVYCATETQLTSKNRIAPTTTFRMVMAGSISPGKNQLLAIEALSLLKAKGIATHLTIIGHADDWYKHKLDQAVGVYGLRDQVEFKSFTESLQAEFDAADCYLLTSRNEAFGRVLVEAGRAGLPCIAPDSGGAPEVITDGQNGLIFKSGNAENLAEKIALLASDGVLYARLAGNSEPMANSRFTLNSHLLQFRRALEAAFIPVQK